LTLLDRMIAKTPNKREATNTTANTINKPSAEIEDNIGITIMAMTLELANPINMDVITLLSK